MTTRKPWVQVPLPAPINYYERRFIKKRTPCEGNIPAFEYTEIHKYLKKIDGWKVQQNEKKTYFLIKKEFKFKNFKNSQKFINKVSEIHVKTEKHHPDIIWLGICKSKNRHSCN